MNLNKRTARTAGLWYLLMAVFYSFSMIYVDSMFFVPGDTTATINNIFAAEGVYLAGFVSCLAGHICFLLLANTLYKLFKPVNRDLARLMVILIIAGVSVAFLSRLNQLAPVLIMKGGEYHSAFDLNQLQALSMIFLELHKYGGMMATVFWGLWLIPLGLLILSSDLIPKILGILLISACFCYLVDVTVFFFAPEYFEVVRTPLSIVESVSEVSLILWLLIKGVKPRNLQAVKSIAN